MLYMWCVFVKPSWIIPYGYAAVAYMTRNLLCTLYIVQGRDIRIALKTVRWGWNQQRPCSPYCSPCPPYYFPLGRDQLSYTSYQPLSTFKHDFHGLQRILYRSTHSFNMFIINIFNQICSLSLISKGHFETKFTQIDIDVVELMRHLIPSRF